MGDAEKCTGDPCRACEGSREASQENLEGQGLINQKKIAFLEAIPKSGSSMCKDPGARDGTVPKCVCARAQGVWRGMEELERQAESE